MGNINLKNMVGLTTKDWYVLNNATAGCISQAIHDGCLTYAQAVENAGRYYDQYVVNSGRNLFPTGCIPSYELEEQSNDADEQAEFTFEDRDVIIDGESTPLKLVIMPNYNIAVKDVIVSTSSHKIIAYKYFFALMKTIDGIYNSNVHTIGSYSFACCGQLGANDIDLNSSSVKLPAGLKRIFPGAFSGCVNLKAIFIPKNVYYIGECAFNSCTSLKCIVFEGKTLSEIQAMENYLEWTDNTSTLIVPLLLSNGSDNPATYKDKSGTWHVDYDLALKYSHATIASTTYSTSSRLLLFGASAYEDPDSIMRKKIGKDMHKKEDDFIKRAADALGSFETTSGTSGVSAKIWGRTSPSKIDASLYFSAGSYSGGRGEGGEARCSVGLRITW